MVEIQSSWLNWTNEVEKGKKEEDNIWGWGGNI